jgi:hypothetical protein
LKGKADENADKAGEGMGFVDLALICTFSRMRQLKGKMGDTKFLKQVGDALSTSTTLQMSEDGNQVRRKAPLPGKDTTSERSIYAV